MASHMGTHIGCYYRVRMLNLNELHRFYESNIPGYERKDVLRISRFFLSQMKIAAKKPYIQIEKYFDRFKEFVAVDWFGWDEIGTKKMPPIPVATGTKPRKGKKNKGRKYRQCKCGGFMVRKQNRETKEYFLGCSTYPKCRNTKPLME